MIIKCVEFLLWEVSRFGGSEVHWWRDSVWDSAGVGMDTQLATSSIIQVESSKVVVIRMAEHHRNLLQHPIYIGDNFILDNVKVMNFTEEEIKTKFC